MRVHIPETHTLTPMAYLSQTYAIDIVGAAANYSKMTYTKSSFSLREFEAARARIAQINGCIMCQQWRSATDVPTYLESLGEDRNRDSVAQRGDAPDEEFYGGLSDWSNQTLYSERERLAIEYAEQMALHPDALAYDEDFWHRMKSTFSDDEIVDLSFCIASWIGLGRVIHALGLDGSQSCELRATQAS